jgi:hypothetical protein
MAGDSSVHDLLTPRHAAMLRLEYWVERTAWIGMGTVLLTALLGALGPGLLSYRRLATADGSLSVEYSAVERYNAPSVLEIRVNGETMSDQTVQLKLSRELMDRTELAHLTPPPARIESQAGVVVLTFPAAALAGGKPIVYRFRHEHFGPIGFDVGLVGGQSVRVQQFVWP